MNLLNRDIMIHYLFNHLIPLFGAAGYYESSLDLEMLGSKVGSVL